MSRTARRTHRRLLGAAAAVLAVLPSALGAQQEGPKNLQVLSPDMPRAQLNQIMRGFTQALGVRCSSCHVGEEGQPLSTYDFASDDKAMKLKAREMLRMVGAINGTFLANLPDRGEPNVRVTCATCHRGVSRPEAIEAILVRTAEAEGAGAAVDRYRQLRDKYYGGAAYDFTDRPLLVAAEALRSEHADAAMRLLETALEFNPGSAMTFFAMAQIHDTAGDKDKAIELYRRVLEIMPDNPQAQRRLRELTGGG